MPRKLIFEVVVDSAAYARQIKKVEAETAAFAATVKKTGETTNAAATAGTVSFKDLGKSVAFASAGYLAFSGGTQLLRQSLTAAGDAEVGQRKLAAQLAATGVEYGKVKGQINQATRSLSRLSGFNVDELGASLTALVRATGDVNVALKLNAVAADVAKGRGIPLVSAATALGKAYDGQTGALRRLGVPIPKTVKGMDAIRIVAQLYSGQAEAAKTSTEDFNTALHDLEVEAGKGLIPILDTALKSFTALVKGVEDGNRKLRSMHLGFATRGLKDTLFKSSFFSYGKGPSLLDLFGVTGGDKKPFKPGLKPRPDVGFRDVDLHPTVKDLEQLNRLKERRNQWFDALIDRRLSRVSAAPLDQQLGMLQKISAALTKRLAVTNDITRKKNLEDQIFAVGLQETQVRADRQQAFFDRLQFNVDKADLTKTSSDNLAALAIYQQAVEKAIKVSGHTLELDQTLLNIQLAQNNIAEQEDAAAKARKAKHDAAVKAARDEQLAWAQYGIAKAETTRTLKDNLAAAKANLAVVIEQAGTGKRTAEEALAVLQAQTAVDDVIQQIADAAKERRQKARDARQKARDVKLAAFQTKIDWAMFALERADSTKTLKDNISRQKTVIELLKEEIKLYGRTIDRARDLFRARQNLKDLLNQGKSKAAARRNPYGQAGYWVDNMFFATNVGGGGAGFTGPTATTQPAMPFSGAGVNIGNLNLYGVQDVPTLENELVKRAATRPQPRRGP